MRPPPYGRELAAERAAGRNVNLFVYAGPEAWQRAAMRGPGNRLAVPEDFDWRSADLSCAAGLELVLIAPGWTRERLDALATSFVQCGAQLVVGLLTILEDGHTRVETTFYRRPGRPARAA